MRAGAREGVTAASAVFAVVGGALTLVFEPAIGLLVVAAVPSTLVGLGWAWTFGKQTDIPQLLIDELSKEQDYTCQPCTAANLRSANEEVRPLFGRDSIEVEVLEQWRLKNPQGVMEIIDDNGNLIACFLVIGLSSSVMTEFAAGRLTEKDITGECVLDMRTTKKQNDIYIAGVMVKNPGTVEGAVHARYLVWAMLMYLKHHFGVKKPKRFYAVPITDQSERLVKGLGFSIHCQAKNRKDKHNFYCIDLDNNRWKNLLRRVGVLAGGCKISYIRR